MHHVHVNLHDLTVETMLLLIGLLNMEAKTRTQGEERLDGTQQMTNHVASQHFSITPK